MATKQRRKEPEGGRVGRLAERGGEAVGRLLDELGRNQRLSDALHRALSAKGRLDSASRSALNSVGLAAADELSDLRKQVQSLEKRLAALEGGKTTAKRSETKRKPTAKKRTATKKEAEKTPSPPAGRALGGGVGRGSSPS
jgi:hypothetical protein